MYLCILTLNYIPIPTIQETTVNKKNKQLANCPGHSVLIRTHYADPPSFGPSLRAVEASLLVSRGNQSDGKEGEVQF